MFIPPIHILLLIRPKHHPTIVIVSFIPAKIKIFFVIHWTHVPTCVASVNAREGYTRRRSTHVCNPRVCNTHRLLGSVFQPIIIVSSFGLPDYVSVLKITIGNILCCWFSYSICDFWTILSSCTGLIRIGWYCTSLASFLLLGDTEFL